MVPQALQAQVAELQGLPDLQALQVPPVQVVERPALQEPLVQTERPEQAQPERPGRWVHRGIMVRQGQAA